jgi:hypothetical protein
VTQIPYLMPLALAAYAGYRYWARAQRSAEIDSATSAWALREGLVAGTEPPVGATPTLSLPQGSAHDCWQLAIGDGGGTLFRWTWVIEEGRDVRIGEATVVAAMLAAGFPHFRVVPRHGFVAPSAGWDEQELHLESVELEARFRVLAGRDGDRQALLELFDPETIVWLINQGRAAPVIEYQQGTLVVASQHPCTTDVELDALAEQARHLAGRVLAEGLLHRPDASSLA